MKVLVLNGSPRMQCTDRALQEVEKVLAQNGIDTVRFNIGSQAITGCTGCLACKKLGKCVIDDLANQIVAEMRTCDGFIVGSPVYYASANGTVTALLDRMFYSGSAAFAHKPGAAIVSARRAGTTASLDQLTKYFTICQMPVVSSTYWTMVHGSTAADVEQDREGLQIMRNLGKNMAWLLKCIQCGWAHGIPAPMPDKGERTNFIR